MMAHANEDLTTCRARGHFQPYRTAHTVLPLKLRMKLNLRTFRNEADGLDGSGDPQGREELLNGSKPNLLGPGAQENRGRRAGFTDSAGQIQEKMRISIAGDVGLGFFGHISPSTLFFGDERHGPRSVEILQFPK